MPSTNPYLGNESYLILIVTTIDQWHNGLYTYILYTQWVTENYADQYFMYNDTY